MTYDIPHEMPDLGVASNRPLFSASAWVDPYCSRLISGPHALRNGEPYVRPMDKALETP
jgi:hypothetical protein